jgi:hypothetical protein
VIDMYSLVSQSGTILAQAQSLTDWLTAETKTIGTLVKVVVGVGATIWVGYYFVKNKSLVALIVALLTAGLLVWGVSSVGSKWFQDRISQETKVK